MSRLQLHAKASYVAKAAIIPLLIMLGLPACKSLPNPAGPSPASSQVQAWITTTDRSKLLSHEPDIYFSGTAPLPDNIEVDPSVQYQEIVGFGAAITDASAWLILHKLSSNQREALLHELFGSAPGLGLSFARLTIGSSEYTHHHYSFDDVPAGQTDPTLANFSLDAHRAEMLPVIKSALAINPRLRLMATPWSAPGWMKTSDSLIQGSLRPEAYDVFAEYMLRFITSYEEEGVPIYAISLQNEPHFEPPDYPGMRIDSATRARLIGQHIGPRMAQRGIKTRILEWDHNWNEPDAPLNVLADPVANNYVSGVAWHCYAGDVSEQLTVRNAYPNKEVYFSECSGGEWDPVDGLTWLTRNLIIGSTRGWAKGILLWNLALDEHHGPHLGGCSNCRGVVTINSASGEVTRNAEYYVLAHASRFVRPGAHRIDSSAKPGELDTVAFQNADDDSVVLIIANSTTSSQRFSASSSGRTFQYELPAKSVATFIWQPQDLR